MTRETLNPLQPIAIQESVRQFGDLPSIRAEDFGLDLVIVASILGNLFLAHVEPREAHRWERTVRAAHYYLDRAEALDVHNRSIRDAPRRRVECTTYCTPLV
jgi:hypothetical protein